MKNWFRYRKMVWALAVVWSVAVAGMFGGAEVYAGVNDFYFEEFVGDYYLSKDAEGISQLKVVETLTAVFPDYKQNKGICRDIPFTNQAGANVTLPNLTRSNIKVTRNGTVEPIYSIEKINNYFEVCTGTEEYVLGKQVYTFEYEFEKIVTDFDDYQELYWDTNGNGWLQKFNKVVARVHFDEDVMGDYTGKSWCYVGKYGESGQERCKISEIADGVEFETENLKANENLTFDVELKAGSFVVPEPERNYMLVAIMFVTVVAAILSVILGPVRAYLKTAGKRKFYKNLFVKPEYQPNPDYSVAEMAEIYIGEKKDAKVAVLLDMIVKKKILLIKTEGALGKKKWKVKVLDLDGVGSEGRTMLTILNGGLMPAVGEEVEIKRRMATKKLVELGREYDENITGALRRDGLVEEKYAVGMLDLGGGVALGIIVIVLLFMTTGIHDELGEAGGLTGYVVGGDWFLPVMWGTAIITIVIWSILSAQTSKYKMRTEKGLAASRYMDGVKLYIKMAEADRMKMLQSVEGADVSNEGIVRLYEKLLPYAAVLGLEDSWMKELEKYYQMDGVAEPEWYRSGVTVRDMYMASLIASSYTQSATTMSPGGGGSSSGFSGGGGGGFSGGGGGGGGGGGR